MAAGLRGTIETNLRAFTRVRSAGLLKPAAVAIVVMNGSGTPSVPIFQRTSDMSRHASQMALPGGRLHEGESAEGCAVRELHEELGLGVGLEDVVGLLDDFDTRSGFTITPVVIWADAETAALQPSKFEVAQLFVIAIPELRAAVSAARPGQAFSLRLKRVEVFAPTAAILYQFSEVGLDGRPARVTDFYQPPFTHH
ncbi:MAG TPA: CoA pyrophosphatase [Candidatus Dormibacteraeota bacterium]|nr:CoA pyrophosphatase [Candidatus Dormibacteraeota bacterium]